MEKGKNLLTKLSEKLGKAKNKVSGAFKKIKEQFKRTGVKIAATVLSLAVCASVAFTVVNAASNIKPESTDPEIEIETTIDNVIEELPGLSFNDQALVGSHGNKNEPNQSPSIEEETPSIEEAPINDVDLIDYMVTNGDYNTIIAKANGTDSSEHSTFYELDPHPYTYLESKGYNIESIKKGETECYSISYTLNEKPNSVFIATQIYRGDFADHLVVEYNLTDNQMEDFKNINASYSIQAALVNDAISAIRKDHIVSESCVTITSQCSRVYNDIMSISFSKETNSSYVKSFIRSVDKNSNTFVCDMIPIQDSATLNRSGKMLNVTVKTGNNIRVEEGINYLTVSGTNLTKVSSQSQKGFFNQAQDVNFLYGYDYITP